VTANRALTRWGQEVLVHEGLVVRGDSSAAAPPLFRGIRAQSSEAGFSFFIANDSSASPFAISIALRGLCFARAPTRRDARTDWVFFMGCQLSIQQDASHGESDVLLSPRRRTPEAFVEQAPTARSETWEAQ